MRHDRHAGRISGAVDDVARHGDAVVEDRRRTKQCDGNEERRSAVYVHSLLRLKNTGITVKHAGKDVGNA